MNAQDLQNTVQTLGQVQLLLHDRDQDVDANGNPNLCLNGVHRVSVERFDAQILLDPLEEQLHLPAVLVEPGDAERIGVVKVREEHQIQFGHRIEEMHLAEWFGIRLPRVESAQSSNLVGSHPLVGMRHRPVSNEFEVAFGANHIETFVEMQSVKSPEIQVSAIHNVNAARFVRKAVEQVHVVNPGRRYRDVRWNGSPQIQHRMHFHARRPRPVSVFCPREQTDADFHGGAVQSISRVLQVDLQLLPSVQLAGTPDQAVRQVRIDLPRPSLVGIGKSTARHRPANPEMIEHARACPQTTDNVAQTLSKRQLRKRHTQKLVPTGKRLGFVVSAVAFHKSLKLLWMNPIHQLREYGASGIHAANVCRRSRTGRGSNRSHP